MPASADPWPCQLHAPGAIHLGRKDFTGNQPQAFAISRLAAGHRGLVCRTKGIDFMKATLPALCATVSFIAMPLAAQDAATAVAPAVSPVAVESAPAAAPIAVAPVASHAHRLPSGTQIALRMSETVTTKGNSWKEGDMFKLAVASDVRLGNFVVIPQGTPAMGKITWLTSRGAFGKSGKMDVSLEHIELQGRRIPIDGTFRQEGEGNTLATIGGVIAAGIFAGFITGKSGVIPQGRELMATLEGDLPVALPEGASAAPTPVAAVAAPTG